MRLPEQVWKRSIWKQIFHRRKEVLPASSGIEYARILPEQGIGYIMTSAVVEANNRLLPLLRKVLAAGCEPVGITACLLLPEKMSESELRSQIRALEQECAKYGIELMQIDVQYLKTVQEPLLQATIFGKRNCFSADASMKIFGDMPGNQAYAGQSIVMSGWAGMEGTQKLVQEKWEIVKAHFPLHFIRKIDQYDTKRLPWLEQRLAMEYDVTAMQAAGEEGVFDALWQLGESVNRGMKISLYQIPIRQETIEIADLFEKNPYQIAAGSVLLMVTNQGEALTKRLIKEGLPAAVIGNIHTERERVVFFHEEKRYLEPYRGI